MSFVPADWKVRVFGLSGIVDRIFEHLSVWTVTWSRCVYRRSGYMMFNSMECSTYYQGNITVVQCYHGEMAQWLNNEMVM